MKSKPSGPAGHKASPKRPAKATAKARQKVYIVEDHPVFRRGLVQLVDREKNLCVCGQAGTAEEALEAIVRLEPDIVLVDITLPGKSGLELIKELRAVNRRVKLLVVSMHDEALYADRVMRAGGDGYIMKQEDPEEIINAIHDVLGGRIYLSEEVLASRPAASLAPSDVAAGRRIDELTDAELEILELLGRGKSDEEIASQVQMSVASVQAHCRAIKKKLNLKTANALIRYAVCWVETGAA
jgi:DNA-binding NarL/FixJ family response regulator